MTINSKNPVRVRFAPSPTGFMHLGNVRTALLNFIFAKHYNGTFILRIEDTDTQRNVDPAGKNIMSDLSWLNLNYAEGPIKDGNYGPYYQSQRQDIYNKYLNILKDKDLVYRCFCTAQELEAKRQKQMAQKLPPRYDRACCNLDSSKIEKNLENKIPFIWRFKLDHSKTVKFFDLAHKDMEFELKHFSDIPLTRQDGTFTFIFANFVDDHTMDITYVLRGEDHLTNTASQVALYNSIDAFVPKFWHLPILVNTEGKKLSKRDFGFSLNDLRNAGFLPEAICNYLGIIGGSFSKEILSLEELSQVFNFENISPTGHIKYDIEKLRWVNHQWILNYPIDKLTALCKPYLEGYYGDLTSTLDVNTEDLKTLISAIQPELITLKDAPELLKFYFKEPEVNQTMLDELNASEYRPIFSELLTHPVMLTKDGKKAIELVKDIVKRHNVQPKPILMLMRLALTGKASGLGIDALFKLLSQEQIETRLKKLAA